MDHHQSKLIYLSAFLKLEWGPIRFKAIVGAKYTWNAAESHKITWIRPKAELCGFISWPKFWRRLDGELS